MEQRTREVAVRHLQAVVESPQRRAEGVRHAVETSAGRGVRLEHEERLADLLRQSRIDQKFADGVHADRVGQIVGEDRLGVLRVARSISFLKAIVVRVSTEMR